jgi:hypothetical protein
MTPINPKLVLDPMWICQANHIDLEYYNYVLLAAKAKYLKNLDTDFSNFYEIVFHYLNLNTVIADKKVYDSHLNTVSSHKNLDVIVSHLVNMNDSEGKEIVKMALVVLSDVLKEYLSRQILVLEHLNFHFNNPRFHKEDKIYIVTKSNYLDKYEVYRLNTKSNKSLGYSISKKADLYLPDLKPSEFKERLLLEKPNLADFDQSKNVIVVSGTERVVLSDGVGLTKDIILINRLMNPTHGFDANVLLDYSRFLEKKKTIPFKLRV